MKLDPALRVRVLEMAGVYAARLSVQEPLVLMTQKEVLGAPREHTAGRRTSAYKYYGVSYLRHNTIFVNVRKIPDEAELEKTVAHEMVHMRFPYLSHGKRFNSLVRRAMRGGRFAPYRRRAAGKTGRGAPDQR